VRKSKVDGGCYEVYGTDPQGNRVEAYFHPGQLREAAGFASRAGAVPEEVRAGWSETDRITVVDRLRAGFIPVRGPRRPNAARALCEERLT
jgi:hypothetical protein